MLNGLFRLIGLIDFLDWMKYELDESWWSHCGGLERKKIGLMTISLIFGFEGVFTICWVIFICNPLSEISDRRDTWFLWVLFAMLICVKYTLQSDITYGLSDFFLLQFFWDFLKIFWNHGGHIVGVRKLKKIGLNTIFQIFSF